MPDIQEIAKQIVLANVNGELTAPLPEPLSVADAYAVQNACIKFAQTYKGLPGYMPRLYTRAGYKIGATSKEVQ
jgi:2-keto-4-pentenoate hydratase